MCRCGCAKVIYKSDINLSWLFVSASHLVDYNYCFTRDSNVCSLVVDCGYSFTHIVPFINGEKVTDAIRRIDIGGKALTNYLKEVISYRSVCITN